MAAGLWVGVGEGVVVSRREPGARIAISTISGSIHELLLLWRFVGEPWIPSSMALLRLPLKTTNGVRLSFNCYDCYCESSPALFLHPWRIAHLSCKFSFCYLSTLGYRFLLWLWWSFIHDQYVFVDVMHRSVDRINTLQGRLVFKFICVDVLGVWLWLYLPIKKQYLTLPGINQTFFWRMS